MHKLWEEYWILGNIPETNFEENLRKSPGESIRKSRINEEISEGIPAGMPGNCSGGILEALY